MSNRNRTMKKKNKSAARNIGFLTAIALSAVLAGGQFSAEMVTAYSSELTENRLSVFPDNITIDKPTALENVLLPANDHGTLEWADGSYIPQKRVQSCEVILTPAEGVDLSAEEGWDEETGTVTGYVHVIVTSITETKNELLPEENSDIWEKQQGTEDTEKKEQTDEKTLHNNTDDTGKTDAETEVTENEDATDTDAAKKEGDLQGETTVEGGTNDADISDPDINDADINADDKDPVQSDPADGENIQDPVDDDMDVDGDSNIFDDPISPDEKDERPSDAEEDMSDEEKEARAQMNHTCDGITVSGINLPWYVQFRVSSGESYQFTNESDAMIFQSYEFELWDLQNNTEYEIPSGEYISVTVPVKAGYEYTIEHLLDNGAVETIIPSVDGNTMVFSTHSFSPFGIAGSKQLVGPDAGDDDTGSEDAPATDSSADTPVTPEADMDDAVWDSVSGEKMTDTNSSDHVQMNDTKTERADNTKVNVSAPKTEDAVNTGDDTTILPFVIVLIVAAVVIIGAAVFMKKKKK